jgi:hypothetical protein
MDTQHQLPRLPLLRLQRLAPHHQNPRMTWWEWTILGLTIWLIVAFIVAIGFGRAASRR